MKMPQFILPAIFTLATMALCMNCTSVRDSGRAGNLSSSNEAKETRPRIKPFKPEMAVPDGEPTRRVD
jgi:hypothetical protein